MRRVLIYIEDFLSPSMTFVYRQLQSLERDWEVHVVARSRRNELLFPWRKLYAAERGTFERLKNRFGRSCGLWIRSLSEGSSRSLSEHIDSLKPVLIHAHFGPSACEIQPVAEKLAIPLLATFHGYDASSLLNMRAYRRQLADLRDTRVLTVSREMAFRLTPYVDPRTIIECLHLGIPVGLFGGSREDTPAEKQMQGRNIQFIQVANFVEKKGHLYTIQAFSSVAKLLPNSRLLFVGDGPLRARIEATTSELGLLDRVQFVGHQPEQAVAKMLRESDVFVHHSVTATDGDREGIPTALMEAMAAGLVPVSTRHSGIPELISDEIDGYLVAERDSDAFANRMLRAASDDGRMGRAAAQKIRVDFNLELQTEKLSRIYSSLTQ